MVEKKYDLLGDLLARQVAKTIILTFEEIERIIGSSLPDSVTNPQVGWWSATTNKRSQSHAWVNAGFQAKPDYDKEIVTFIR